MTFRHVYHKGILCSDRITQPDLDKLATRFYERARLGLVVLTQRKLEDYVYEYLCQCPEPTDGRPGGIVASI
jgi:hypothetical protein